MERFEVDYNDPESNHQPRQPLRRRLHEISTSLADFYAKRSIALSCMGSILVLWLFLLTADDKSSTSDLIEGACQGIYNNLGHPPFADILIAPSCPEDYEELSLGNWPAPNIICSNSEINASQSPRCWPIYLETQPLIYTKWKDSSICAKMISEYMNNTGPDECPPDYIRCNKICIFNGLCPITSMEFSSYPLENTTTTSSVITPFGNYLNYRREQEKMPIGGLALSFGQNTPCLDIKEYPQLDNIPAIKFQTDGCNKYGEFPGYQLLDADNAQKAFVTQPWSTRVVLLPELNEALANEKAYLSYVPRLELEDNANCTSVNFEGLIYVCKRLNTPLPSTAMFAMLILASFLGMAGVYFVNLDASERTQKIIVLTGCFLIGIFAGVGWHVISVELETLREYLTDIKMLSNLKCFVDPDPQQVITDVLSEFISREATQSKWFFMMIICLFWYCLIVASFFSTS